MRRLFVFLFIICVSLRCSTAQKLAAAPSQLRTTQFEQMRQFLVQQYPGLNDRWLRLSISEDDAFGKKGTHALYNLLVTNHPPDCGPPGRIPGAIPISPGVSGPLDFSKLILPQTPTPGAPSTQGCGSGKPKDEVLFGGTVETDRASGEILSISGGLHKTAARVADVRKLIDQHREWSEKEINDALKSAGAGFAPENAAEFRSHLNLSSLRPLIGTARILSVTFDSRDPETNQDEPPPYAALEWKVEVEARLPGNKPRRYLLVYEPFDGTLSFALGKTSRGTTAITGHKR